MEERDDLLKLLIHENVEARLKSRGLALLEPVDLKLGQRPFRGILAHDLAAIAEKGFPEHSWAKVPDATKKGELRAILEAVLEVRGPFTPEVEAKLPADVWAEYQRLMASRGR